jgi:hypothetical protein
MSRGAFNWRRARTVAAWVLLIGSIIGWPLSSLTWARGEPPFVLGLSWLAIILTSADLLATSQVHEEAGDRGD